MKFKEALKAAGLPNPGRTTWHGTATDGTPVFTIWGRDIRQIDGRFFAWWTHGDLHYKDPSATKSQIARRRAFVEHAERSVGRECRAVIVHDTKNKSWEVAAAEYPHPQMAIAKFMFADADAVHFVVELLPPPQSVR